MTQVRYVDQLDLANFCLQSLLPLLLSITKAELSSLTLALSSESVSLTIGQRRSFTFGKCMKCLFNY